jgi:RHS repeat-associated protein
VLKGRNWSTEEYRYGFNGKEKDDEFSVEDGSYDFGARMYDARLGRWWSVDELHYKFSGLSVYNFAANSPILVIDSDGRENIIWLLVTDKAKNENTLQKNGTSAELIAKQANDNFKLLGLKTEVRIFQGDAATFEILKMNLAKDAVAVIGADALDTKEFVRDELDIIFYEEEGLKLWKGGYENPEESENNQPINERGGRYSGQNGGEIIAIDGSALKEYGKKGLLQDTNSGTLAGGLLINHGAGHNARQGHLGDAWNISYGLIMMGGDDMKDFFQTKGSTYKSLFDPSKNYNYIKDMKTRFNADMVPVDDYKGEKP